MMRMKEGPRLEAFVVTRRRCAPSKGDRPSVALQSCRVSEGRPSNFSRKVKTSSSNVQFLHFKNIRADQTKPVSRLFYLLV